MHVPMLLISVLSPYHLLLVMIISCETGVPPGQHYDNSAFHAADPLWDGGGCGPTSICCTFNNPPWFCKQLPQSTNADLEVRLCSSQPASLVGKYYVELIEIYVR